MLEKKPDAPAKFGALMAITDAEFEKLSTLIYRHFGIHLTEAKRGLLVRRLQNLLTSLEFKSFAEYYDHLVKHPSDAKFTELVNRITTNYTFFNREPAHFEYFSEKALPEIINNHLSHNNRDLRIWCAAASTGEEPYMLSILMMEALGGNFGLWDSGILATDISEKALTKAKIGRYNEDEFQNMPKHLKEKYFQKVSPGVFEVVQKVKSDVTFRRFNLINPTYPFKKPFDVIFCRNVMIYFDEETKVKVVHSLHKCLSPGGYLFIGHSESIMRHATLFKYVMPALYRKI